MRRRDFLPLAAAAITWNPTLAEAAIPRIGFIHSGTRQENQSLLDAFHDGLAALAGPTAAISRSSTSGQRIAPSGCPASLRR